MVDDLVRRYQAELEQLRRDLAPLKSGDLRLHHQAVGVPQVDMTQHWIEHLERTIGLYEEIIARQLADSPIPVFQPQVRSTP